MNAPAFNRARPASRAGRRVAVLLRRYPDLSREELEDLIESFQRLSSLDFVLLNSNAHLAPIIDRFRSEHRHRLKDHHGRMLVILLLPIVMIVALAIMAAA